jgi:ATP-dependent Clp protease ATP-binding subunit ClpA
MGLKTFSSDLTNIQSRAATIAVNFVHTTVQTPHFLIGLLGFLNENKNTERYKNTYKKIKDTFSEYEISGRKLQEEFLEIYPRGLALLEGEQLKIRWHEESRSIFEMLKRDAFAQKRTMEIEDFIRALFSDRSFTIHSVIELLLGGSTAKTDELFKKIVELFREETKKEIKELEKVRELTNLNKWVAEKKPVVIGADNAVKQIELALSGKSINNAILVGPAGTGKTVSVYEFVNRVNQGLVTSGLKDKIIYQLDSSSLLAGTRYRGDMEEKLINIVNLVKANPNVILFIDEAHMMTKLGAGSDDAGGAGDILKPFISRGEIQMIWATTSDEYQKHIDKDKALARRFHKVNISEPSKEDTRKILYGILPSLEEFFNKKGSKTLVNQIVDIAEKYTLDQANPAKAINALELAFANSKVFNEDGEIVLTDDIINSISIKYDIYLSENKGKSTEDGLRNFILGQDNVLDQIIDNINFVEHGLVDLEKPLVSMIFAGPTGVGKTETAKIIAEKYFGSERNLIKLNMGEYGTEMDVTKLTGASPGYIGHDDETGLVSRIKQYPSSVVLFDEIEKAHPKVFDTILNILDTGEMTDNHNNRVSFRNAIIIFTTNLGYEKDFAKSRGVGFVKHKTEAKDIRGAIEKHFRPEFINRIDDIIVFNGLTTDVAKTLIDRYLEDYRKNMSFETKVEFLETDYDKIIESSEIETYGARGLKRAVRKQMLEVLNRMEKALKVSKRKRTKKKEVNN